MQIVIAWVVGSPLVAVLVGKMISLGDRTQVSGAATIDALGAAAGQRFEPTPPLLGASAAVEAAA